MPSASLFTVETEILIKYIYIEAIIHIDQVEIIFKQVALKIISLKTI